MCVWVCVRFTATRWQVPKAADLPAEVQVVSQTTKVTRVTTLALQGLHAAFLDADEQLKISHAATAVALLRQVLQHSDALRRAAHCVAVLDCLYALYSRSDDDAMCVPTFVESSHGVACVPVLELMACVHPIAAAAASKHGGSFVANDITIGWLA